MGRIARVMLDGAPRELTDGAHVLPHQGRRPLLGRRVLPDAEIGAHLFYTDEQMQMASNAPTEPSLARAAPAR
jgi:hypothetical protein